MLRQPRNKGETEKPGRKIRFPRICVYADLLHVTRVHLYRVLTGERKSPELMRKLRNIRSLETRRSRAVALISKPKRKQQSVQPN